MARHLFNSTLIVAVALSLPAWNAMAAPVTGALPHFAVGGGFITAFYVVNTNNTPANFSISFYDDTGKPVSITVIGLGTVSILSDTIPANGTKYYEGGDPNAAYLQGSAAIASDSGITVQALFRRRGSDNSYYEAAVLSTAGNFELQLPFDDTTFAPTGAQVYTGIAIANLDPLTAANVVCTARDSLGNFIPNAVAVPPLNALGHWAGYLFPSLVGLRGTLDCTSNTKIGSVGFRAIGTNAISSLPVIGIR